jgi:di/tripeptidase
VELTAVNYLIRVALSKYFAGGHNFHGKYEYVPVESMQKQLTLL